MNKFSQVNLPPFTQKSLQPDTRSSYKFLEEMTYKVDLRKLYIIKSTCYTNVKMPYCPVLVQLSADLQQYYPGYHYLLQVWDDKNERIYERPLQCEITVWNVFYNYFVYKPQVPDENYDCFHIVNLEHGNSTILVPDFTQNDRSFKYVAYDNNVLYVGSHKQIKLLSVNDDLQEAGEEHRISPDESEISTITPDGNRIHGFFINGNFTAYNNVKDPCILVAFETPENYVDLNTLHLLTAPGAENFTYQFKQFRPMVPRKQGAEKIGSSAPGFDEVQKYQLVFDEADYSVGVAMKKSKNVDFYHQGMLCLSQNQEQDSQFYAQDVEISFDETFIQTFQISEDERNSKSVTRGVSHDLQSRQSISESRIIYTYNINNVFYQRIKSHCKIFKGFVYLKTFIFVAHGKILSLYDMLKQKFTQHMQFEDDIIQVFRSQVGTDNNFDICVLLENGKIKFINEATSEEGIEDHYKENPKLEVNVDGRVIQFDQDRDDNAWTFILVERLNGVCSLQCLHDQKLYNISDHFTNQNHEEIDLNAETNFVFFFSPKDVTEVMIHQGDWFFVYEIDFDDEKGDVSVKPVAQRRNVWVDKSVEEKEQVESAFVEEGCNLHAAIRVNEKGLMILTDDTYFYVINFGQQEANPARYKQMCAGIFLSDNNYMYALSHKNKETKTSSGFRLYDIENCISQVVKKAMKASQQAEAGGSSEDFYQSQKDKSSDNELMSYHLQSVQVGCQGLIDFSHQNQRLVYQSSYDFIDVVPVLHRNTISFIGMGDRQDYLATKVIDDKFIALNKKNQLTTWCTVNGKMRNEWHLRNNETGQDYSNYEIYSFSDTHYAYQQDWASKVLLKCKTPVSEAVNENEFYDPAMTKSNMRSQISFIKRLPKTFYEFKLIEILNDKEVKEHFSFIFPYYGGGKATQHMFFSKSGDRWYMFERLINARAFIYKSVSRAEFNNPTRIHWEQVHRFSQFPSDLVECTDYPYMFSPDFSMYLDVDRKGKKFLIKDSFTQETKIVIPEHVMNFRDEDHIQVAARFVWLDNSTLKYINSEGIERKIDITHKKKGFKELQFNVIPMFSELNQYPKMHYYFRNNGIEVTDTLKRLKHKYAAYKSAIYLENKTAEQTYSKLITVDYSINNYKERYVADLSFSFLHWNLVEKLEKGLISVDQIDKNQFQKLIYNILPGGETIFHRLSNKGNIIVEILKLCHPNKDKKPVPPIETHIPFVENFQGKNPIDLLADGSDFRTMNQVLLYLSAYGIDHHSRTLAKILPLCVEKELPNLDIYIDSRLQQTKECRDFTKGNLRTDCDPGGVCVAQFCISNETQTIINRAQIESELNLQFFDVPVLHQFDNAVCNQFFNALADTKDMELFNNKGIKNLIEFRWPLVREYVVKRLFLPFVAFLFTFVLYMGQIYEWRELDGFIYQALNYIFMIILLVQSAYFIGIELYQLSQNGLDYFNSFWNYLDLIPPIQLIVFIPLAYVGTFDQIDGVKQNQTLEASLQATMSLLLWLKFLYFLRIFKSTGYLIKIIISVCVDMRHFMLILFLTIMAFGDSMRAISTSNLPQHVFIEEWWQSFTYVYRMILGDFNTDPTILEGGPVLVEEGEKYTDPNNGFGIIAPYFTWCIFYLCTVLNMIIMLNLLIAIISESFSRINQEKMQASYQEKCDIIAENTYLVPHSRKIKFCKPNRYLLIATDIQQELESQAKDSQWLLKETARKINESTEKMEKKLLEQIEMNRKKSENSINFRIDKIIQENAEIIKRLKHIINNDEEDK